LGDRKDIWPIQTYVTCPKGSLPELVEEENEGNWLNSFTWRMAIKMLVMMVIHREP